MLQAKFEEGPLLKMHCTLDIYPVGVPQKSILGSSLFLLYINKNKLVFSIGIILVDVHLNWLNWFHFLILEGDLLVILMDCMASLSPSLDVVRMSMSAVSFLAQLNSGILYL